MTSFRVVPATSVVLLAFAGGALAQSESYRDDCYGSMWSGGWGMMGAGSMILFWILVVVLVIVAVRWLSQQDAGGSRGSGGALKTLEERLARGEIDVAEFAERKKALSS